MRIFFVFLFVFITLLSAERKLTVAVLPFLEVGQIAEKTGFTLSYKIQAMLSKDRYHILGVQALKKIFQEAKIENPLYIAEEGLSQKEAMRLQVTGVDALVVGTVSKHYKTFTLSYQIFYLENKVSLQSASVDASSWTKLLNALEKSFQKTRLFENYPQTNANPYYQGMDLFAQEKYTEALPLLQNAGKLGYASAFYNIGWYHENIKKDENEALSWYKKAGQKGHRKAKSVASRLKTVQAQRLQQKALLALKKEAEKVFHQIEWKGVFQDIQWKDVLEDIQWKTEDSSHLKIPEMEWKDALGDIQWKEKENAANDIIWKEELQEESIEWKGKAKKEKLDIQWKDQESEKKAEKPTSEEVKKTEEVKETEEVKTK